MLSDLDYDTCRDLCYYLPMTYFAHCMPNTHVKILMRMQTCFFMSCPLSYMLITIVETYLISKNITVWFFLMCTVFCTHARL